MRHLSSRLCILPLLAGAVATSCVDNSYDLDDVDYTLASQVDLTLPQSSTSDITLRNFLSLKDDGLVDVVDGIFCVRKTGEAHIDPVHISEIRIAEPDVDPIHAYLKLRDLAPQDQRRRTPAHGLSAETFLYDINRGQVEYVISESQATDISPDVVSMESARFHEVTATLRIAFVDLPTHITTVHVDDLTIELPRGLKATRATIDGRAVAAIDNERGLIHVTPATDTHAFSTQRGLTLDVVFDQATVGEGGITFDPARHSLHLSGAFTATGTVRVETDEMELNESLIAQALATGSFAALRPGEVEIDGQAGFSSDVVVSHFTGDVVHEANALDAIDLDNMPDFLNDPDVVLDLQNPIILLTATSDMSADATTRFRLTSRTATTPTQTDPFTIHGKTTTTYYLADQPATFFPEGYTSPLFVRAPHLGGLIRKLPKQVDVDLDPIALHCEDLDVMAEYPIAINYEIFAPLTVGPQFELVYRDSEEGWIDGGDLDDLCKVDCERLTLVADAFSNVPANVVLTLEPVDADGNLITALKVSEVVVPKEKTTPVELTIEPAAGHTINDALAGKNGVRQIDGLRYVARIKDAPEGATFKESHYIKLTNIKVHLTGNVSYDAN